MDDTLTDRMCLVTREVREETELVRFVRGPDGSVVPDLKRKLPGRGVWVGLSQALVAEAVKRNLFAKGFGEEVKPQTDLPVLVADLLRKEALSGFSLARKAGLAVTGFMKVESALNRNGVCLLVHAAEAAVDGCQKLDRLAGSGTKVTNLFAVDELSLAFGQSNVIHAAVNKGGIAEKLLDRVRRVELFAAPRTV